MWFFSAIQSEWIAKRIPEILTAMWFAIDLAPLGGHSFVAVGHRSACSCLRGVNRLGRNVPVPVGQRLIV